MAFVYSYTVGATFDAYNLINNVAIAGITGYNYFDIRGSTFTIGFDNNITGTPLTTLNNLVSTNSTTIQSNESDPNAHIFNATVATITAGTLSSSFVASSVIDGHTLSNTDIILIKNQTNPVENGLYQVNLTGAPTRSGLVSNTNAGNALVYVNRGTVNANTQWICTNTFGSDVVGQTGLTFRQRNVLANLKDVNIGTTFGSPTGPPYNADVLQYNTATSQWENHPGLWDDIRVPVFSTNALGSNPPTISRFRRDVGGTSQGVFLYYFSASTEQELYFTVQLPHSYLEGSNLFPHVHFVANTVATGTVIWGLEYTWANVNGVFPTTSIVYGNTTFSSPGATLNQQYVCEFNLTTPSGGLFTTGLSGTGKQISSMLVCRIFRASADAADTYSGTTGLLEIDFHFQQQGVGSTLEYLK